MDPQLYFRYTFEKRSLLIRIWEKLLKRYVKMEHSSPVSWLNRRVTEPKSENCLLVTCDSKRHVRKHVAGRDAII